MANKRMYLSANAKEILDKLCDHLECDRPYGLTVAFAKGITDTQNTKALPQDGKKWTVPDNVIRGDDYLLLKHLIINELNKPINDEDVDKEMSYFIEKGLAVISHEFDELASIDDYQISIMNS